MANIKTDQQAKRSEFKTALNEALGKTRTSHVVWKHNDSAITVFVAEAQHAQVVEIAKQVFGPAFHFESALSDQIDIHVWGWLPEAVFEPGADAQAIMVNFSKTRGRLC